MNTNEYEEIINGKETYQMIAKQLRTLGRCIINWDDEQGTCLDIIFNLGVPGMGRLQRGLKDYYLFVSIIDHTSFGFNPDSEKMGDYIQEKLRMNNPTGDKLKELINGIIRELNGGKNE